jgi:hypothetical protein
MMKSTIDGEDCMFTIALAQASTYWTSWRTSKEPRVCKEWRSSRLISTTEHGVSFCDKSGNYDEKIRRFVIGNLIHNLE